MWNIKVNVGLKPYVVKAFYQVYIKKKNNIFTLVVPYSKNMFSLDRNLKKEV